MEANPNRRPGSNRGHTTTDWEQAFAYYATLPPGQRSYQAVADKFGVSARTVEKHGRTGHWKQRLREIEARAAAQTNAVLGQARADHLGDLVKLIQASLLTYADQLRRGDVRMNAGDLERLHKLWQQLAEQIAPAADASVTPPATDAPSQLRRPPEHTAAVIEALAESGALTVLGLQLAPELQQAP